MSEIITDKLTGKTSAGDVTITSEGGSATMQLQQGLVKGWVNFTTYSSTSIRDSHNISSATDIDTGKTTINLTSNMNNSSYAGYFYASASNGTTYTDFNNAYVGGFGSFATSSFSTASYASAIVDSEMTYAGINGDLA